MKKRFLAFESFMIILLPILLVAQELSPKQVFRRFNGSVVIIEAIDFNNLISKQGSGVVIKDGQTIVTNFHVFSGMKSLQIRHYGKCYRNVKILAADPALDLLILKTDSTHFNTINFSDYCNLEIGDKVYALGSPEGLENSISQGIISGFRVSSNQNYIQITAPISKGSSGGAVINAEGELIGISTLTVVNSQNLNFAIPITSIDSMKFNCINASDSCYKKLTAYVNSYNLVKSHQYKKAIKRLITYTKIYGVDSDIYKLFMESLAYMGINDSMVYYLNKSVKYWGGGLINLANGLREYLSGNFFLAINRIHTALIQEPNNGYFYYYLALLQFSNRKFTKFPIYKIISYLVQSEKLGVSIAEGFKNYLMEKSVFGK